MSEVCSIVDTDQFAEAGHSVDKCGFYGVSLLKHAGHPGQAPTGSAADVAAWADAEYVKYDGADVASNGSGMTVGTEYSVIQDAGLHYQGIGATETGFHPDHLTAAYVEAWLHAGYPVILAVAESEVLDLDLGGSPYAWDTAGLFHIIVATGYEGGALLCHDTASISPSGVRKGPRRYDAQRLQAGLISATAVVLPWTPRPASDFDPTQSSATPTQQEEQMYHYLTIEEQSAWYEQAVAGHDDQWKCKQNGVIVGGDHLKFIRYNGGVEKFGLVKTAEIQLDAAHHPEVTAVVCERGVNFFDPNFIYDKPPEFAQQPVKSVYPAQVGPGSVAWKLLAGSTLEALQSQLTTLSEQVKKLQAGPEAQAVAALTAKLAQVETLAEQIAAAAKA